VTIHVGHLELILEVRDGSEASQDDAGIAPVRIIHQQPVEVIDLDAARIGAHIVC